MKLKKRILYGGYCLITLGISIGLAIVILKGLCQIFNWANEKAHCNLL